MENKVYRISEIAQIRSGKRLPAGHVFSDIPTQYPYIRARDIKKGKISTDNLSYLDEITHGKLKRYIIEEGDVAITIVANIGDVGYCTKESDKANLTENAVRLTGFDSSIVNSKYLTQYLGQPSMKKYMESLAAGAAQAKLGIYKIEKIKVSLPPVWKQERIAAILSEYDLLIDNNERRIDLLKRIADNIYKEWFVRFRFPGYEKEKLVSSKMGNLPSSFKVLTINEVFDYYIGGGWGNDIQTEEYSIEANVIRGADFPGAWKFDVSTCPVRYHKASNYKLRQLEDGDIIMEISGGTAEQPVGRTVLVTKEMIDRFKDGKVICASFCKLIRLKKNMISPYYFYYWMHYLYDTRIIERYQLQSTGIINFKFETFLRKGYVMMPPRALMTKFEEQVRPIFKEINLLAKQIDILIHQRDLLLPRLMSGKLEVKG